METFKPNSARRSCVTLWVTACLITPMLAGETPSSSTTAGSEVARRAAAVSEAHVLLKSGDQAYTAGRYSEAVEDYAKACSLIPSAPISAELRQAATDRFAQATVEHARGLSRLGDLAAAKAAVDRVLVQSVAPTHPGAMAMRAQLDDPIRTNPALTPEHAKNVDSVRRLLYTAEGAYDLGKFDESKTRYEDALRIDPTNTAARRGLEKVAAARSSYSKAAYDHTRSEMLSQVEAQWEQLVPPAAVDPSLADPGLQQTAGVAVSLRSKLENIVIPQLALDQTSLAEAIDFLRASSVENDTTELDPDRKGVNFTLNLGPPDSPAAIKISSLRFDLQLTGVPLSQILKYLTDITKTSYSVDEFAVKIVAVGATSSELVSRSYRVPPDFISSLSSGVAGDTANPDPFGEAPKTGLLVTRLGAQEALTKQGVVFPPGASASLLGSSLQVVNTEANQDYISQVIETITKAEPVIIAVRVTMIKVQQTRLEELGFDWILDNFGFGGAGWVPGSSRLNLTGGSTGNGRPVADLNQPPGAASPRPLTAGNRSGDSALSADGIDSLINDPAGRQGSDPAPGILGLRGGISGATYQLLMRGLDQSKGVDMMAKPVIITRSGQSSTIGNVREFIYATEYEPPELPQSTGTTISSSIFGSSGSDSFPVTPATPTAFEKRDVGVTLEVLPVADAGKQFVNVTLNPSFSDFDGFVNYGSPIRSTSETILGPTSIEVTPNAILMPVFSQQGFTSSVDVADGATIVVGGLLQESVEIVNDKTPILGSIPVIGRLFQSRVKKPTSTAILFLVNVEIMDPTGRPYRDR